MHNNAVTVNPSDSMIPMDLLKTSEYEDYLNDQRLEERVMHERMHLFMTRSRMISATGALPSLFVAYMHWPRVAHESLIKWCLCLLFIDIVCVAHSSLFFRASPRPNALRGWRLRQIALQSTAALAWGSLSYLCVNDPAGMLDRTIIYIGASAYAVISFMPFRLAAIGFTLALWCIPFYIYMVDGDSHKRLLAVGMLVVIAILNAFTLQSNKLYVNVIRKRFESEALAQALKAAAIRIHELATRDELTGLFNRRYGMGVLKNLLEKRQAGEGRFSEICLLLIDVDHFKHVNDNHGHPAGDEVLRQVSQRITAGVRPTDVTSRIGGEEFMVMLPETGERVASQVAQNLCDHVAATPMTFAERTLRVTVSIGVVEVQPGEVLERALARADAALYRAKHQGRNCCVLATPTSDFSELHDMPKG